MTIEEIAKKINSFSAAGKRPFSGLQMIRYKHGANPRTWKPFALFSIKYDYAFHAGGRKELQFNIGEDFINGETVFRYGIAFSLKEDKTLHNSKAEFKDIINRFNIFLSQYSRFFKDYQMWYYSGDEFGEYFENVKIIDDELFKAENFIFIGKYFEKEIEVITDENIKTILVDFDYLIPLYELVQFGEEVNFPFPKSGLIKRETPKHGYIEIPERNFSFKGYETKWSEQQKEFVDIGNFGEELVIEYEQNILREKELNELSEKVKKVADGNGFDIESRYEDGSIKHIEVKSTTENADNPFPISINEIAFSEQHPESYHLYRVFNLNRDNKAAEFHDYIGNLKQHFLFEGTQFNAFRKTNQ